MRPMPPVSAVVPGFHVDGLGAAGVASLLLSIASALLSLLILR